MLKHLTKEIICLRLNSYTSTVFVLKIMINQGHFMVSEKSFIVLAINSKILVLFPG